MYPSPDPAILNTLSHTQQQVLRGLVAGQSISAAAREAGVHRATVHLWVRTVPTFGRALDAHRRLRTDRIASDLDELADSALGTLRQLLDDPDAPAAIRYKAAIEILGLARQFTESTLHPETRMLSDLHAEFDASPEVEPAPPVASVTPVLDPPPVANHPVRNAPCPCGSRVKYKRCCGALPAHTLAA